MAPATATLCCMVMPVILGAASAASDATLSAAATTFRKCDLPDDDDLEGDLLEGQLIAGPTQESHRTFGRLVDGPEFDPDGLARQMGEVVLQLPVEDERDIGIELFLKLPKLAVAEIPGSRLEHGEHEHIVTRVMGKGVEHPRPLDP